MKRAHLLVAGAALMCTTLATHAYPTRPLRFIVPFPPAGGTDILGRVISQKLGERLGQQVVIDNRPGAAGTLGTGLAAKAAPDGHTLLLMTGSLAIAAGYYRNLPFDVMRNFDAVGQIATVSLVFVAHPALPAPSIRELVALAKAQPDKLNYASGGEGGVNHVPAELFKQMTGTRITHVPYRGAGPALNSLLAGETQLMVATLGSCLAYVRAGRLRALALAGAQRSALVPELPTVAEAGYPGYAADNWYGVVVPHGTPRGIVATLNREISAAMAGGAAREQFTALGFEVATSSPEDFSRYLASELAKWARVVKSAGLSPP